MNLKLDIRALSAFAANKWRIRDKNHQSIYSRGIRRSWPRNIDCGSIEELTSEGWWRVYRGVIDFPRLAVSACNTSLDRDTAKNKSVEQYVVVVEISKERGKKKNEERLGKDKKMDRLLVPFSEAKVRFSLFLVKRCKVTLFPILLRRMWYRRQHEKLINEEW